MFYEIELESTAGLQAIQLDASYIGGEAAILVRDLAMQAEITKTDMLIVKRDFEAQYASLRLDRKPSKQLTRARRD